MQRWRSFLILLGMLAASYVLTVWTPLGPVLRLFNTLVHEMSHGLVALLTQGKVYRMALHPDLSGVTQVGFQATWAGVLTAVAGYVGATLWSTACLDSTLRGRHRNVLLAHLVLVSVALLVFISNPFGRIWGLAAGAVILTAFVLSGGTARVVAFALSIVLVEQSVTSTFALLTMTLAIPSGAGDAALLANLTGIPAVVWAVAFTVLAVTAVAKALTAE